MNEKLKEYLTMQIYLNKLDLVDVQAIYPDFEMEED